MKWRAICIKNSIVADEVGDTEDGAILNAKVEAENKGYDVDELEIETEVLSYGD
jgi:hypothetical protein